MRDQSPTLISRPSKTVVIFIIGVNILAIFLYIILFLVRLLTQEPNRELLTTLAFGVALFQIRATRFLRKRGNVILTCQNLKVVVLIISVEILTFVSYFAFIRMFLFSQDPNYIVLITLLIGTILFHYLAMKSLSNKIGKILDCQVHIEDNKQM